MNQEIFGLRYDFVYRHGHYMELYREKGIKPEELSGLQLRMLEANTIPHLLPLEVKEVDFHISLLYNLNSKRMLSHVLKVEGFTCLQFAKVLYTIVCTLEESRNYMLHENGYVLKDNFIYIGTDWSDVYLTYVPLHHENEEVSVLGALESFKIQLADKVRDADQRTMAIWLEQLSQNRDLTDYRQKLITLMDEGDSNKFESIELPANHKMGPNKELLQEESREMQKEPYKELLNEPENGLPKSLWNRNEDALFYRGGVQEEKGRSGSVRGTFSFVEATQRTQIIFLVACLLLTAFLWQNYLAYPSSAMFRITLGLTLLFTDLWFVMKFRGIPWYNAVKSSDIYSASAGEGNRGHYLEEPQILKSLNIQDHYQKLHMHTTLLGNSKPNVTVFLGNKLKRTQGALLEVMGDGGIQTFALESNSFLIGRGESEAKVDFVLDESGVSRLHVEIMKDGDKFGIKDLGSTNGTFLNGEALVAYQAYPLQEGDVIRIVRSEITFREFN
ncbi:DUF6382 domain-containing protein [Paenibacillus sp. GCM10027628]|uniref:DUF6382 domain-containing protein n=1 Tax=Paenibacillus sp. GCM10027628 TaxID=3273413 RepID=UPI00362CE806